MCAYKHTYTYMHVCIHTHARTQAHTHTHTHTHTHIYIYIYIYIYVQTWRDTKQNPVYNYCPLIKECKQSRQGNTKSIVPSRRATHTQTHIQSLKWQWKIAKHYYFVVSLFFTECLTFVALCQIKPCL